MEVPQFSLVTFALLAYNQEEFIRNAVEAALAQGFSNQYLIISGNASSNITWSLT